MQVYHGEHNLLVYIYVNTLNFRVQLLQTCDGFLEDFSTELLQTEGELPTKLMCFSVCLVIPEMNSIPCTTTLIDVVMAQTVPSNRVKGASILIYLVYYYA